MGWLQEFLIEGAKQTLSQAIGNYILSHKYANLPASAGLQIILHNLKILTYLTFLIRIVNPTQATTLSSYKKYYQHTSMHDHLS